jgi:glycine/D-amino acid oxidase-like deaminating enzyme
MTAFAPDAPSILADGHATDIDCDIAIVGAGVGGATLAWALREAGVQILVIEQGDFLSRERENWSPRAVHGQGRYKNSTE